MLSSSLTSPSSISFPTLFLNKQGLSGPAILRLSAFGARLASELNYNFQIVINWVPALNVDTFILWLESQRVKNPSRTVGKSNPEDLTRRLWQYLLNRGGIQSEQTLQNLTKKDMRSIACECCEGIFSVCGKGAYRDEFVTAGGVCSDEIDFTGKTFSSKIEEHRCRVYVCGEILDVDGVTGGFNFQSAWTSGYCAGHACAMSLLSPVES